MIEKLANPLAADASVSPNGSADPATVLAGTDAPDQIYRETLAALASALETRGGSASNHAEEVAELAVAVGAQLGLGEEELRCVELGALLHDIGKISVPEAILSKPGPLTEAEWQIVRAHPEVAQRILEPVEALRPVLPIVRGSHERWDGTGYPDGLAGEDIPLGARIVAACEAYRAMVESRPYRQAPLRAYAALRELRANAGAQFDLRCVETLAEVLAARAES